MPQFLAPFARTANTFQDRFESYEQLKLSLVLTLQNLNPFADKPCFSSQGLLLTDSCLKSTRH